MSLFLLTSSLFIWAVQKTRQTKKQSWPRVCSPFYFKWNNGGLEMTEINEYKWRLLWSLIYKLSSYVHPFFLSCSTLPGGNPSMSTVIAPLHCFDRTCDSPCRHALIYLVVVPTPPKKTVLNSTWFHFVMKNNISVEVLWPYNYRLVFLQWDSRQGGKYWHEL